MLRKVNQVKLLTSTPRVKIWFVLVQLFLLGATVTANTPPRFTLGGLTDIVVRVKEGPESLGKLLYQLSADDADGDKLQFGVQGPVGPDFLRIESTGPKSADVYLQKELDREVADSYSIFLTLTDMKLPNGQFIIQPMLIIVDDINDNEPVFKPFRTTLTVREDATPSKIESVEAVDRDAGPFGQVIYDIQDIDDESDKTFGIETFGGKGIISLKGKLDYEKKSLYQLRVIATDLANNGRRNTGTAALLVKVEDVEDQPPVFVAVPSVTRVPEDLPVNSRVLSVKAIDGDRGVNNQITYRITKGGYGLFGITRTTGEVIVRGRLDREATDNRNGAFILEIQAEEISPNQYPPPSVTTEVTIILTDVNDETPQFRSRHYTAEINENAQINVPISFLGNSVPEVFDHDQGNNGTFKMFLEDDDGIFEVTPSEGVNEASFLIRVKRPTPIDYEQTKVLNFKIVAKEVATVAPKSSTAEVTVYIRDMNDNFPEFTQDIYRASIPENAKQGTAVAVIKAEDKDSGGFGTSGIRYTDIRGQIADKLHLDPLSGAVTVRTNDHGFDRESASQYYVTIEARDNNGQGNRNSVQLMVILEDVNDNTPRFLQGKYEARINENEAAFSTPLVVQATDDDLKGTDNSEIRYQIVTGDPDSNFTVNSMTGEILPRYPLDFERIPQESGDIRKFNLIVRAYDLGSPSLNNDVNVVVYVQDKNDHAPVFKKNYYSKAIPEDTRGGTSVLQVSAVDDDQSPANSKVVYRIRSGAQDKFVIDADSGTVSVSEGANLDPDRTSPKTNVYLLEVLSLDGGFGDEKKQSSVLVNISVIDVNNKAPTFLPILDPVTIREDAALGSHLTTVSATDLDERPVLRYSIDYSNTEARNEDNVLVPMSEFDYEGIFDISSVDGSIKLVKRLDREKVESFKLVLKVEDTAAVTSGQSATASLIIKIMDVNDNRPVFKKSYYQKAVPENSQTGVPIVTVTAEDADKNRTMLYTIEGSFEQLPLVNIDSQSGEIFVNSRIDREVFTWLNLTVRATDSGYPALSSTVNLYVQILDENDNNPVFADGPNEYLVSEDSPVGKQVALVLATDADDGDYGRITYLLDATSAKGKFRVDRETGSIIVAEELDRESTSVYSLIVQAWDNYQYGFPTGESRKTFKQITIRITDVNDETPVFVRQQICASITEFHRRGDTILMISANDADDPKTANGKVLFSIQNGNEDGLFDIRNLDRNTAKIISRDSLKTRVKNYTLSLRAQDQGIPSHFADETFKICVSDVNDNPPIFVKPAQNFSIRIPENATVGSVVVAVEARDSDFGQNGEVRYRLKELPNGHWKKFHIDPKSGSVTLKELLDRETQRIHEIRIEAYDLGHPTSLSADLELTVFVTDINDYAPEFTEDTYEVMFTENLAPGEETFRLLPTIDKDETDSALKPIPCYFIVGGNELGRFQLDIFTHHIYTTEILDREERSNYTLLIQASDDCFHVPSYVDKFDPRDNTMLQLKIGVRDQNDNAPKFTKKIFTGGVTTETDFGTIFTSVKAIDSDSGANSVVNYYLVGSVQRTLSEGLENLRGPPFVVDRKSGDVVLNFDPQKEMKGYFDFEVLANDTDGLSDKARVFVYLLREDQRVKFVLRLTPEELREKLEQFRDVLGNITGAIVNTDFYKYHENSDGSVDKKKTNLYLHFVKKDDNSIMEVNTVLELIDKNIDYLDELFKEFNVLYSEPAKVAVSGLSAEEQVRAWLIGLSAFLLVLLVLVISMCLTQRSRYERQLKAATATAFGSQDSALNRVDVPNTNQHSVEGSNPIWMHAYDNEWYKEDEEEQGPCSLDDNSLDENAVEITEANNAAATLRRQQPPSSNNPDPDDPDQGVIETVTRENSINGRPYIFSAPTTIVTLNGNGHGPFGRPATLQSDHLTRGFKNRRLISDNCRFTLPGQKPAKRNITFPDLDPVPNEEEEVTGDVIERVRDVMNGHGPGYVEVTEESSRENDLNRNYDENVFGPTKKEALSQRITKLETSEL